MSPLKELLQFSKSLKVLYVEDDVNIRDNYTKIFTEVFDTVDVADNGKDGLERYQQGQYDIIITDINMPRMNGIEMIREITRLNADQTIIVTSAHDDAHYLLELIELGIGKFLIKPVNFNKLTTVLHRACKRIIQSSEFHAYQASIEEENRRSNALIKELQHRNSELEATIRQLMQNEQTDISCL